MKKNINNSVVYYTFNIFSKTNFVRHCFSTKFGGVSTGNSATMNLAFKRDSQRDNVYKNFNILCDTVGFNYNDIVLIQQEHTANVQVVNEEDRGNILLKPNNLGVIDGAVTNKTGVTLSTLHADCVPIYFFDPIKKVIGLCHAGWKGTVDGIAEATLTKMVNTYGCNVEDILVGIGPSIGVCCFEVDKPVKDEFETKLPNCINHIIASEHNKYNIDMWQINKQILIENGVLYNNIEIGNVCTKCNCDIFHSHRVTGFNRGCMVAMLSLES